ncbi:unnamed protein product [Leptidea sinapis]|uniref:Uncharacterized protein n=1 Tax=Leptidea sinapis TaxID=189913 RepID=A0A5E4QMJ6_9NEOP|nr:unnamed protein product [Leptidea sinapis]
MNETELEMSDSSSSYYSSLPDLILQIVPSRRDDDESKEFYEKLERDLLEAREKNWQEEWICEDVSDGKDDDDTGFNIQQRTVEEQSDESADYGLEVTRDSSVAELNTMRRGSIFKGTVGPETLSHATPEVMRAEKDRLTHFDVAVGESEKSFREYVALRKLSEVSLMSINSSSRPNSEIPMNSSNELLASISKNASVVVVRGSAVERISMKRVSEASLESSEEAPTKKSRVSPATKFRSPPRESVAITRESVAITRESRERSVDILFELSKKRQSDVIQVASRLVSDKMCNDLLTLAHIAIEEARKSTAESLRLTSMDKSNESRLITSPMTKSMDVSPATSLLSHRRSGTSRRTHRSSTSGSDTISLYSMATQTPFQEQNDSLNFLRNCLIGEPVLECDFRQYPFIFYATLQ